MIDEGENLQEVMAHFSVARSPGDLEARKNAEQSNEITSSSCLIRASPLAIWGHRLIDKELEDVIREELTLTHTNKLVIQACVCYALFIKYLIVTNGDRNYSLELVYQYATLNEYNEILKLLDCGRKTKGTKVTDCTSNPESYEHGFVWGVHLVCHEYNFTDALSTQYG